MRTQLPARERLRSAVFDLHRHDAGSSELNLAPPSIKLGFKSRSIPESPMPDHLERATKVCPVCGRPFQWRKNWKDVWEQVRYCSERCRRRRASVNHPLGSE